MITKLRIAIFILVTALFIAAQAPEKIRIFTIGDSTVQNYSSGYYPRTGWGQVLHHFFNDDVQVINRAVGGTSSRSFYNDFWTGVKADLRSGDYVFIQFGINDRATDAARKTNEAEFKAFLKLYVSEAKAVGAIPVLVSTVRRNSWQNGLPYDSYHEHPGAVRAVALELGLPCIDLDSKNKELMIEVGPDYSKFYTSNTYDPGDHANYQNGNSDEVHFQEAGALELADAITEEIIRQKDSTDFRLLYEKLAPQYLLKMHTSDSSAGSITRRNTYPAGTPITLRARPTGANTFLKWHNVSSSEDISSDKIAYINMPTNDIQIVAFFNEIIKQSCDGEFGSGATLDLCGICSGGTTDIAPYTCAYFSQPEDCFEDYGYEGTGFTGSGYLKSEANSSSIYEIGFTSNQAITDEFAFKYSNGSGAVIDAQMFINGQFLGSVTFPETKGWFDWNIFLKDLPFFEGENKIELKALSELGLPYIDLTMWKNQDVKMKCVSILPIDEHSNKIDVYPNPFENGFNFNFNDDHAYEILDLSGVILESGNTSNKGLGEQLKSGIYLVNIKFADKTLVKRIIKQ